MAETVNTNQFKNGMHIELDGEPWRIVEFQHVKPGKGGAFVRTKLKALGSGAVVDRTFRAGEKFPRVHTEVKSVQYLYDAGDEVVFMDKQTFEQFGLARTSVADELEFLQPSSSVQMLTVDGKPGGVQLPASLALEVVETEPGIYLSGLGGIRIEDLAIVGDDGPEVLTSFPKELVTVRHFPRKNAHGEGGTARRGK